MPDQTSNNTKAPLERRDSVRIHTNQIEDACIDKDCIEDLRVYLTAQSQQALNSAANARARSAELLHVYIDVEPIAYNRGRYTADLTFFYRITGEALCGPVRPLPLVGLAIFNKRVVLYGGEVRAKVFSSEDNQLIPERLFRDNLPNCTVEVVDPMVLSSSVQEAVENPTVSGPGPEIPQVVSALFEEPLCSEPNVRRLFVTLGQFSTVRMERGAQLLIPAYDFTVPDRTCTDDPGTPDEPCDLFAKVAFPTEVFYPKGTRSAEK